MNKMIIVALALVSSSAFAKWAPIKDTTSLTCQEGRANIIRNGFQNYTVAGSRYETFYADANNDVCAGWQRLEQAWVPTADAKNCPIGFTCVDQNANGGLSH